MRARKFPVSAAVPKGATRAYSLLIAADVTQVENEVAKFNGILFWSLAILGVGLIAAIFIQVRIGLQPLNRVSLALAPPLAASVAGTRLASSTTTAPSMQSHRAGRFVLLAIGGPP